MWKRIHKKLSSRSGETLAEVLIALLIIALSTMLLVVMINTAGSIDIRIRGRDKTFYEDLTRAETHTSAEGETEETGKVIITDADGKSTDQEITVKVYGGNGLISYEVEKASPSGGGGGE